MSLFACKFLVIAGGSISRVVFSVRGFVVISWRSLGPVVFFFAAWAYDARGWDSWSYDARGWDSWESESSVLDDCGLSNATLVEDRGTLYSFRGVLTPPIILGDGGGRPSSVMSLGVTSVGGHSHGHPASPIGVGSLWEDIDPRSPEPLVVRGGWLWLIWVVRWTT